MRKCNGFFIFQIQKKSPNDVCCFKVLYFVNVKVRFWSSRIRCVNFTTSFRTSAQYDIFICWFLQLVFLHFQVEHKILGEISFSSWNCLLYMYIVYIYIVLFYFLCKIVKFYLGLSLATRMPHHKKFILKCSRKLVEIKKKWGWAGAITQPFSWLTQKGLVWIPCISYVPRAITQK